MRYCVLLFSNVADFCFVRTGRFRSGTNAKNLLQCGLSVFESVLRSNPRYYRSAPPPSSGSDTDRYDTVFNKNHRSKSCSDITAIILCGLPFSVGVNSNQRPGSSYSPPAARPVHTTRKSDFNLIEFYTQKGQLKSKSSFLLQ